MCLRMRTGYITTVYKYERTKGTKIKENVNQGQISDIEYRHTQQWTQNKQNDTYKATKVNDQLTLH